MIPRTGHRHARGIMLRAMAAAMAFGVGGVMSAHARTPVTYYARGSLDSLRSVPSRFPSPRPRHAPDLVLREADSLYRTWRAHRLPSAPVTAPASATGPVAAGRESVIVTFRDREATEFAREVSPLAADSTLGVATADRLRAQTREAKHAHRRQRFIVGRVKKLVKRYGGALIDTLTAAAAVVVDLPRVMIEELRRRTDVVGIQPLSEPGDTTSGGCTTDETAMDAGTIMGINRFRAEGFGGGRIGLLDSGVRSTHPLFQSGRIEDWVDCADSLQRCRVVPVQDDVDPATHGTASAAILVGVNEGLESENGITSARLTSYRVYQRMGARAGLFRAGAGWAFENALSRGFDVIAAEITDHRDASGVLTRLAGEAFDRGTIVVAAGGNYAEFPLPAPAIAPRTLAVGAYCIHDRKPIMEHSRGRAPDGRVKPDLNAPTGVYAAANSANAHDTKPFTGTSGATPFAAAAALYLKNWMSANGRISVFPGEVYAMMLACGDEPRVDEKKGVGLIALPTGGTAWWGRAIIGARQAVTIPLAPPPNSAGLEVALWWPEYGRNGALPGDRERASIALQVRSPDEAVPPRTSADAGSVFQRVSLPAGSGAIAGQGGATASGPWMITIAGEHMPRGAREVYWAAWARPGP